MPESKTSKPINKLVNFVQDNINKLYKNTYYSQADNKLDLETLKSDIDASIDNLMNNNLDNTGIPNISTLYSRIKYNNSKGKDKNQIVNEIEGMFDDKSLVDGLLMSSYNDNRILKEYDEEIDLICKYMPQLEDALDAKKDNVLAADHFSKDFINVINTSNINVESTFNERIKELKKKYNLIEFYENIYDKTAKYGEQFIYCVPYSKAISKLVQAKDGLSKVSNVTEAAINEAFTKETDIMNINFDRKALLENHIISESDDIDNNIPNKISVKFNLTGILEKAVKDYTVAQRVIKKQSNKLVDDNVDFEGIEGQENLINNTETKDKVNIKVPGCILRVIPRENVIPLYIDNLCLGYYCIEHDSEEFFNNNPSLDPLSTFKTQKAMMRNNDMTKDRVLKYLSSELSKNIDAKFINANQDLSKEIYMILKSNDILNGNQASQLKISFIDAEDMIHMYFSKNPKTQRGISDLDKALLPAKMYTSLYVTNTVGYLTRGFDKRVYYVKQSVDTNIAQTLLNTINQIKKSNFGARELTNVKGMLNMTGRYNDYVIPLSTAGDAPVQFEVIPGQNIEVKTELMNQLEQMAINSTDVPYEYVQSRQTVDYAVRLTMSSGKFLRKAFKRQVKVELFLNEITTRLYNYEYEENDLLEVSLPPPAFLNILNTNQMLQNTNDYVQNIVETEAANESDEFKAAFTKKLKRYYLSTYIDYDTVDKIKEQTRMELKVETNSNNQNQM